MLVGDTVHYTDAANVRGTCWDMTGPVIVVRRPTKREPRFVIKWVNGPGRRYATADQLKPLEATK